MRPLLFTICYAVYYQNQPRGFAPLEVSRPHQLGGRQFDQLRVFGTYPFTDEYRFKLKIWLEYTAKLGHWSQDKPNLLYSPSRIDLRLSMDSRLAPREVGPVLLIDCDLSKPEHFTSFQRGVEELHQIAIEHPENTHANYYA